MPLPPHIVQFCSEALNTRRNPYQVAVRVSGSAVQVAVRRNAELGDTRPRRKLAKSEVPFSDFLMSRADWEARIGRIFQAVLDGEEALILPPNGRPMGDVVVETLIVELERAAGRRPWETDPEGWRRRQVNNPLALVKRV